MMGFDLLALCRERQAAAAEDLADFEGGQRQFRDGVDFTDRLIARAKDDVEKYDHLIAACEKRNARS